MEKKASDRTVQRRPLLLEPPASPAVLPALPGSYILELALDRQIAIRPGKLGEILLGPGRLRYYGSARGPGGVRSRVARHLRRAGTRHWHVDWLLAGAAVRRVLVDLEATECDLLRRDLESGRWAVAAAGFGSSDCRRCPAHLLIEVAATIFSIPPSMLE